MKDLHCFLCSFCSNQWYARRSEPMECESCGNVRVDGVLTEQPTIKDKIDQWVAIGQGNAWIAGSHDPIFNRDSFGECETPEDLKEKFVHGNWCLGSAFYIGDLCFINQVNGGDEWLTIKHGFAFESMSWQRIIEAGEFEDMLNRLTAASAEQCKKLTY